MVKQIIQHTDNTEYLEFEHKNIDYLDVLSSTVCTKNGCKQSELRIGCPHYRSSSIKDLKYYFKHKIEDMKLQTVDYKSHFKEPCFNCLSSFHGSRYEDGNFNIQKVFEVEDACEKNFTAERSFYHSCNICNVKFKNFKLLVSHRRRKHNIATTQQCAPCHLSLAEGGGCNHIYTDELINICPYCSTRYASEIDLKLHILRVCNPSSKKDFKCELCPMEFNDKDKFKAHQDFHGKLFTCKFCDKCFSSINALKCHSYTHTGGWPYNCNFCNKGFPTQKTLSTHILSHLGKKPYSCKYCPNLYKLKQSLEVHMFEHTGGKQFECDLCDKSFAKQYLLNEHKLIHIGGLFQCKYCAKEYTTKYSLDVHLFEHTGGKLFGCDLCTKTFATQRLLNQHKPVHMEKLFQCKYCPKQFKRVHSLDVHIFEHIGGKQFKCDICDKTFAKQHLLNQHKPTHMERSFQCTICSKFIKRPNDLRRHIKRVHKILA